MPVEWQSGEVWYALGGGVARPIDAETTIAASPGHLLYLAKRETPAGNIVQDAWFVVSTANSGELKSQDPARLVLDHQAPQVIWSMNGPALADDVIRVSPRTSIQLEFSDYSGLANFEYQVNGQRLQSVSTWDAGLQNVALTTEDFAGNVSPVQQYEFSVDSSGPTIQLERGNDGIKVLADDPAGVARIWLEQDGVQKELSPDAILDALEPGAEVYAEDTLGNVSSASIPVTQPPSEQAEFNLILPSATEVRDGAYFVPRNSQVLLGDAGSWSRLEYQLQDSVREPVTGPIRLEGGWNQLTLFGSRDSGEEVVRHYQIRAGWGLPGSGVRKEDPS